MEESKYSSNRSSMSESHEFCEHRLEMSNYCGRCNIFLCGRCSNNHQEHVEEIIHWKNILMEYLSECLNYKQRAQILLHSPMSVSQVKENIMSQIDIIFDSLEQKLREYRAAMKEEVWGALLAQGEVKDLEQNNRELLENIIDILQERAEQMYNLENEGEKEGLIDIIKDNPLSNIDQQIQIIKSLKYKKIEKMEILSGFRIREDLDYNKCLEFVTMQWPIINKSITTSDITGTPNSKISIEKNINMNMNMNMNMSNDNLEGIEVEAAPPEQQIIDNQYLLNFNSFDTSQRFGEIYSLVNGGKTAIKKERDNLMVVLSSSPYITSGKYEVVFKIDNYISSSMELGIASPATWVNKRISTEEGWCITDKGFYANGKFTDATSLNTGDVIRINLLVTPHQILLHFIQNSILLPEFKIPNIQNLHFSIAMRKIDSQITIVSAKHYIIH